MQDTRQDVQVDQALQTAEKVRMQNKKNKSKFERNQTAFVWGWLALPIISWIVFYWYVNFSSFVSAFQDPITGAASWINFQNIWTEIVGTNGGKGSLGSILVGFENTMKYFALDIFVKYPIQLIICYFLYKQIKGYKVFRFIFYLPAILPGVVLSFVFKMLVDNPGILSSLGMWVPANGGFLGQAETATNTILVYCVWVCLSGNMLLLCGAMNRIPIDVLEAARLDGIGPLKEFIHLIIPMIWPTLSTLLVLTCCSVLNAGGPILLLAPDVYSLRSTTISHWIYEKVLTGQSNEANYNMVSAAGLMLSLVAVPFVLIVRKLFDMMPTVEY